MFVLHVCKRWQKRSEIDIRSPGAGVTADWKLQAKAWVLETELQSPRSSVPNHWAIMVPAHMHNCFSSQTKKKKKNSTIQEPTNSIRKQMMHSKVLTVFQNEYTQKQAAHPSCYHIKNWPASVLVRRTATEQWKRLSGRSLYTNYNGAAWLSLTAYKQKTQGECAIKGEAKQ